MSEAGSGPPPEAALQLAAWLGQHWIGLFIAVWLLWLLLVLPLALGAWAGRTQAGRDGPTRNDGYRDFKVRTQALLLRASLPPWLLGRLGAMMVLAAGGLMLGAAFIAELAEHIGPGGRIAALDDAFSAALRGHTSDAALAGFAVVSHLGDVQWMFALAAAVGAALWWREHRLLAIAWWLSLALNGLLTRGLKQLLERARPEHLHDLAVAHGYSFPSGHSSASVVAYGWLALMAVWMLPPRWHRLVVGALVSLIWAICFSRLVLQVHFASDVLAGMASGLAWLAASALTVRGIGRRGQQAGTSG